MPPRPAPWSQGRRFGVVIDAGSSGSRVQVYSWIEPSLARELRERERLPTDVLSRVEKGVEEGEGWHFKVEPGISTLGGRPEDVATYLRPLIEFAASVVPAEQLSSTPIYLLATAGMRLLPSEQQSAVLASACTYIQSFPFALDNCAENVRIISGEEEGLYGWIAVNYLMDGFDKHDAADKKGKGKERHTSSTYGFLDMGGASTQIAFEPAAKERLAHADNLTDVHLRLLSGRDVRHPVFVTTWLGFGTNQARDRYIDAAIRSHVRASDKAHAGAAGGASATDVVVVTDGVDGPTVLIDDPCLPRDLMLSEPRHRGYTLRGTGDFATCVRRTGPLLNKEVECLDQPCLFNGVHVPPIDFSVNHFIGISEYYYSTQDVWGGDGGAAVGSVGQEPEGSTSATTTTAAPAGVYDFVTFERNAVAYCSRQWDDIMHDHKLGAGGWKSSVELSRLEQQCFKAAWVVNILHEGIGIPRIIDSGGQGDGKNMTDKAIQKGVDKGLVEPPDAEVAVTQPSFQSMSQVGDVAISWTLGKMVMEVSRGTSATSASSASASPVGLRPWRSGDWKGHIPSWNGDVRASIAAIKNADPLPPIAGLSLVACLVYWFCLSSAGPRRRQAIFGGGSGRSKRGRSGDFSLLPSSAGDDGGSSSGGESSSNEGQGSVGRSARRSKSPSSGQGLLSRALSPLRYGVFRLSSKLRSWSRPTTTRSPSLPMMTQQRTSGGLSASNAGGGSDTNDMMRPRPLRQSKSTPFLRASTVANGTPYTGTSSGSGWNDAPDLSEMHIKRQQQQQQQQQQQSSSASVKPSVPNLLIPRSHSTSYLPSSPITAVSPSPLSATNSSRNSPPPPPMTIIPPNPSPLSFSRPQTPRSSGGPGTPLGLTKLTPRTRESSLDESLPGGRFSLSASGNGNGTSATGRSYFPDVGGESAGGDGSWVALSMSADDGAGAAAGAAANAGAVGRLRASRSQNSSQNSLSTMVARHGGGKSNERDE